MEGFVDHQGAARVKLDPASTKTLLNRKTPDEIKAEREAREKARTERFAAERIENEKREVILKAKRENLKTERAKIENADPLLRTALDSFLVIERSINPKEREAAKAKADAADLAVGVARENFLRAQQKFDAAVADSVRAHAESEYLEKHATEQLPAARDGLRAAWEANDITWKGASNAQRKASRDRALKNRVRTVLGLAKNDD